MLSVGIKGNLERTVTEELTAEALGSGLLPVFATPAAVALAEETAWRSVAGELEEGQGTVGTLMDLAHIAATPLGMKVRCETELVEVDRRKLVFTVKIYDEKEKVADGRHERFIIDNAKFLSKAEGKLQK
ncbi:MAG: thioesterase [Firmicutes bacterium]|nr:thioesterase [Bacillota bacterium]MBR4143319.1 thioesterase [Bacillota bacterium]MBR6969641.1 thioesterase [Bacillota bacterium]